MSKEREALNLALEALIAASGHVNNDVFVKVMMARDAVNEAIREALEQPAQQHEPVAWMVWTHGPVLVFMKKDEADMEFNRLNHAYPEPTRMLVPLYTSPPASKPLTDEEWEELADRYGVVLWRPLKSDVEAKLREKNA